jgi:hypothetical protein
MHILLCTKEKKDIGVNVAGVKKKKELQESSLLLRRRHHQILFTAWVRMLWMRLLCCLVCFIS